MTSPLSEEQKAQMFGDHQPADDEEGEGGEGYTLTNPGVDDFTVDSTGGIWCGDERIGGPDTLDNHDPNTDSAFKSLELSPRDLQLIGERSRDAQGRYTADPELEQPQYTVPCSCGSCVDINQANITGAAWDTETGQAYVQHTCRCGEERLTFADEISDRVQQKALDEAMLLADILENHMERPPKW